MTICNIHTTKDKAHKLCQASTVILEKDFNSIWLKDLANNLRDTMNQSKATGIAAPQIGVNRCVIAFGGRPSLNFPEFDEPFTILINPSYEILGKTQAQVWEHCLSMPGKRGYTLRANRIRYQGYDLGGQKISAETSGILAVLLQHEIDHLQGILFNEHVKNKTEFGDIAYFEQVLGKRHHIEDGLKVLAGE